MKDDRKSKESPALAAQLRAFSVISSSLRAELSTSRNHSVGKVSAFADESSDRSHPLTVYQRYCGRRRLLRHRPLPQCLSGRDSFIHASQALRPEKRGSPLPMGRTGTVSITLTLQRLQFLRCGCGISADCAEPFGLVSVHGSNPSAFTPSLKPLLPARLTRPKCVTVSPKFNHPCQSRKDHHLSPRPPYRPAPAAPVGLPAHSPEDRKNDASASPFPTSSESSDGYIHALNSVHNGTTSHARSENKEYIHKQQKALSRFCNSLYPYCIQIRYIGDCHQYVICHLCG